MDERPPPPEKIPIDEQEIERPKSPTSSKQTVRCACSEYPHPDSRPPSRLQRFYPDAPRHEVQTGDVEPDRPITPEDLLRAACEKITAYSEKRLTPREIEQARSRIAALHKEQYEDEVQFLRRGIGRSSSSRSARLQPSFSAEEARRLESERKRSPSFPRSDGSRHVRRTRSCEAEENLVSRRRKGPLVIPDIDPGVLRGNAPLIIPDIDPGMQRGNVPLAIPTNRQIECSEIEQGASGFPQVADVDRRSRSGEGRGGPVIIGSVLKRDESPRTKFYPEVRRHHVTEVDEEEPEVKRVNVDDPGVAEPPTVASHKIIRPIARLAQRIIEVTPPDHLPEMESPIAKLPQDMPSVEPKPVLTEVKPVEISEPKVTEPVVQKHAVTIAADAKSEDSTAPKVKSAYARKQSRAASELTGFSYVSAAQPVTQKAEITAAVQPQLAVSPAQEIRIEVRDEDERLLPPKLIVDGYEIASRNRERSRTPSIVPPSVETGDIPSESAFSAYRRSPARRSPLPTKKVVEVISPDEIISTISPKEDVPKMHASKPATPVDMEDVSSYQVFRDLAEIIRRSRNKGHRSAADTETVKLHSLKIQDSSAYKVLRDFTDVFRSAKAHSDKPKEEVERPPSRILREISEVFRPIKVERSEDRPQRPTSRQYYEEPEEEKISSYQVFRDLADILRRPRGRPEEGPSRATQSIELTAEPVRSPSRLSKGKSSIVVVLRELVDIFRPAKSPPDEEHPEELSKEKAEPAVYNMFSELADFFKPIKLYSDVSEAEDGTDQPARRSRLEYYEEPEDKTSAYQVFRDLADILRPSSRAGNVLEVPEPAQRLEESHEEPAEKGTTLRMFKNFADALRPPSRAEHLSEAGEEHRERSEEKVSPYQMFRKLTDLLRPSSRTSNRSDRRQEMEEPEDVTSHLPKPVHRDYYEEPEEEKVSAYQVFRDLADLLRPSSSKTKRRQVTPPLPQQQDEYEDELVFENAPLAEPEDFLDQYERPKKSPEPTFRSYEEPHRPTTPSSFEQRFKSQRHAVEKQEHIPSQRYFEEAPSSKPYLSEEEIPYHDEYYQRDFADERPSMKFGAYPPEDYPEEEMISTLSRFQSRTVSEEVPHQPEKPISKAGPHLEPTTDYPEEELTSTLSRFQAKTVVGESKSKYAQQEKVVEEIPANVILSSIAAKERRSQHLQSKFVEEIPPEVILASIQRSSSGGMIPRHSRVSPDVGRRPEVPPRHRLKRLESPESGRRKKRRFYPEAPRHKVLGHQMTSGEPSSSGGVRRRGKRFYPEVSRHRVRDVESSEVTSESDLESRVRMRHAKHFDPEAARKRCSDHIYEPVIPPPLEGMSYAGALDPSAPASSTEPPASSPTHGEDSPAVSPSPPSPSSPASNRSEVDSESFDRRFVRIPLDNEIVVSDPDAPQDEAEGQQTEWEESSAGYDASALQKRLEEKFLGSSASPLLGGGDTSASAHQLAEDIASVPRAGPSRVSDMEGGNSTRPPSSPSFRDDRATEDEEQGASPSHVPVAEETETPDGKKSPLHRRKLREAQRGLRNLQTQARQQAGRIRTKINSFSLPRPKKPKINLPSFSLSLPRSQKKKRVPIEPRPEISAPMPLQPKSRLPFEFRAPKIFERKGYVTSSPKATAKRTHSASELQLELEAAQRAAEQELEMATSTNGASSEKELDRPTEIPVEPDEFIEPIIEPVLPPRRKQKKTLGKRWKQEDLSQMQYATDEENGMQPSPQPYYTEERDGGSISTPELLPESLRPQPGVLEEIDSDEFFLRAKGISQDEGDLDIHLEMRGAVREEDNVLASMRGRSPIPSPPRSPPHRPMRKGPRSVPTLKVSPFSTFPPERPRRKQPPRYVQKYMAEEADVEHATEDGSAILGTWPLAPKRQKRKVSNGSGTWPNRPHRKMRKGSKGAVSDTQIDIVAPPPDEQEVTEEIQMEIEGQIIPETEEAATEEQQLSAIPEGEVVEAPITFIDDLESQIISEETQKSTHGDEAIVPEQTIQVHEEVVMEDVPLKSMYVDEEEITHPNAPRRKKKKTPVLPKKVLDPTEDDEGYATIRKDDEDDRVRPPRPPPPTMPTRRQHQPPSNLVFFTMPARTTRSRNSPPKRPIRAYSTLRPSRPKRRKGRRRSPPLPISDIEATSRTDDERMVSPDIDSGVVSPAEMATETTIPVVVESADAAEKMRGRPLPPPPRPDRKKRPLTPGVVEELTEQEVIHEEAVFEEEIIAKTTVALGDSTATVPVICIEEEVAEEPKVENVILSQEEAWANVEVPSRGDISIAIQTDPLPEDFVLEDYSIRESDERTLPQTWIPNIDPAAVPEPLPPKPTDVPEPLPPKPTDAPVQTTSEPPIFPSKMQLSELEVDRLSVGELRADKLVVSEIDGVTFHVSEMTSDAGQLNVGTLQASTVTTQHLEATDASLPPVPVEIHMPEPPPKPEPPKDDFTTMVEQLRASSPGPEHTESSTTQRDAAVDMLVATQLASQMQMLNQIYNQVQGLATEAPPTPVQVVRREQRTIMQQEMKSDRPEGRVIPIVVETPATPPPEDEQMRHESVTESEDPEERQTAPPIPPRVIRRRTPSPTIIVEHVDDEPSIPLLASQLARACGRAAMESVQATGHAISLSLQDENARVNLQLALCIVLVVLAAALFLFSPSSTLHRWDFYFPQ